MLDDREQLTPQEDNPNRPPFLNSEHTNVFKLSITLLYLSYKIKKCYTQLINKHYCMIS